MSNTQLPDATSIAPADIPAMLVALAALQSALAARLLLHDEVQASKNDNGAHDHDELLNAREAAARLGRSQDWIYHQHDLPFKIVLPGGRPMYSAKGIDDFIRRRRGR